MHLLSSFALAALVALSSMPAQAAANLNSRGETKLAKALEGRVAGKPVNCINLRDIRSSEIIDRTAILYRVGAGQLYVNVPASGKRRSMTTTSS